MKIGIGITTQNRNEVFNNTLERIKEFAPDNARVVVVDDASTIPVVDSDFRFNKCAGIAKAKNKCFELLDDCDHIFLFDDDTYPLVPDWWLPYVESKEPHLMYIFQDFAKKARLNDTVLLYQDSKIKAWSHARGCMLYFKRICLEKVGGMDPIFGRWGWEHPNLSERIFNAGLTSFKYSDIANSAGLFFSCDEHETVQSTVSGSDRIIQINRNKDLYHQRKISADFIPYKQVKQSGGENVLITTFFTNVTDFQSGSYWEADHSKLDILVKSLQGLKLIVLHDCFDLVGTVNVAYVKVETSISPYFQRWLSIYQYLNNHPEISNIFCIDGTDVEVLKTPFDIDGLVPELQDCIITGDEPDRVGTVWMRRHHPASIIQRFINQNASKPLLNAGILGGNRRVVLEFIRKMLSVYFENKTEVLYKKSLSVGESDMGVFNYVAYTYFAERIFHGSLVNTKFKSYERNDVSWFRHK